MKLLTTIALLGALTACTGCESTSAVVTPMQKPASLSLFKVGDNIMITFPDDSTLSGVVMQVRGLRPFDTGNGFIERSRGYMVHVIKTRLVPRLNGKLVETKIIIEAEVPEFALTLQKK